MYNKECCIHFDGYMYLSFSPYIGIIKVPEVITDGAPDSIVLYFYPTLI